MTNLQRAVSRLVHLQVAVSGFIAVMLFTAYTIVVVTQVYFRYVLNDSLFWAEEFSRLAFFATIMMSLPMVCARNAHIVMDLLESSIRETSVARQILRTVNGMFTIAFFAILCYYGFELAGRSRTMQTSTLGISMHDVYLLMPISSIICIEVVVAQLLEGFENVRLRLVDEV